MLMIPQEEWQSLHEKLDRLIEIVEKTRTGNPGKDWFESDEVREILGISPKRGRTTATNASFPSRR